MSTDDRPTVPNPSSRSRPRWFLLGLVILGGAALWWSKRLTPEERFLVGRWTVTSQFPDGSQIRHDWEFESNRQIFSNETQWNWTANGDRFTVQQAPYAHEALWVWVKTGFKSWPYEPPAEGQLEIINSQEAKLTLINRSTGQDGSRLHLRRVQPD